MFNNISLQNLVRRTLNLMIRIVGIIFFLVTHFYSVALAESNLAYLGLGFAGFLTAIGCNHLAGLFIQNNEIEPPN